VVEALLPAAQYAGRVRAHNSAGASAWSPWTRFTTLPSSRVPVVPVRSDIPWW
jgi:hypothetical protein